MSEHDKKVKMFQQFIHYPTRTCRWLNHCKMCDQDITAGQRYRDGGYGRRAHESCLNELAAAIRGGSD
jgi:hypothetical protein